jgi:hypothetical protein
LDAEQVDVGARASTYLFIGARAFKHLFIVEVLLVSQPEEMVVKFIVFKDAVVRFYILMWYYLLRIF